MKVSINNATGIMHEFTGNSVPDAALIETAVTGGIPLANVEIRTVTQAELDALIVARTEASMTQSDRFKEIERSIEQHMNAIAQTRTWDNRWTCTARAGYANPWQAEAIKFAQWMDTCWQYTIQEQQKVIAGTRPIPTPSQAIAELPVMVW